MHLAALHEGANLSDEIAASAALPKGVHSSAAAGTLATRGGVVRVAAYSLGVLASAISAAMLFRYLGVVNVGRYVTAVSLVAIVGSLSDLGLTAVGIREMSTSTEDERWILMRDLLGLRLSLTTVGGTVITTIAWIAYSGEIAAGVALASVGLLLLVTQDNFALPLAVDLRLGRLSALDLSRQLLTTLLLILLVVLDEPFLTFLAVPIPVGLVLLVATTFVVRRTRALAPTFNWRRWRALLGPMVPYSAAVAASSLYYRVSVFMLSGLSNSTQLGYFSASFRILEALMAVPTLLMNATFPILARASRDDPERFESGLRLVFQVALVVGAWVAVSTTIAAPLAISVIGGARFHDAAPVLALQGVGLGAMFGSTVWSYGLLSLGMHREILLVNASALALNAGIVAPLVLVYGARGAALGTALTEIAIGVSQSIILTKRLPHLRPPVNVLPRIALAAAAGLCPLALSGVPIIARLSISTVSFSVIVLITRALPTQIFAMLPTRRIT